MDPDADGDGVDAIECGGRDCDDSDDQRYPGNTEVCDGAGVDEDCDAATFGFRDQDMDGFGDASCCNGDTCGNDCDDTNGTAHPGEAESCDTFDNDCDGSVDEGTMETYWPDLDGDDFGDASAEPVMACAP
ncbi:MAG: hypothetical protein GWO04_47970, partial [Actinobacteria bacterium]|nr:hypothetical protein [Actinomycetota bacterium]